ncbi:hypothetical protein [Flavobacterium ajazii]|uniref:hypothetical protein n=1 Tax=Flavobacterium ajazii TaxID=2692318 RepID=UPI0013CF9D6A|nr:hypothetical protein [Flavobacterium ajazii]
MAYHYQCIGEWFSEEWEQDEIEQQNTMWTELNKASHYGNIIFRKIYNLYHLNYFKHRIDSFALSGTFAQECLKTAIRFFAVMQDYPNSNIFQNTLNEQFDQEDGIIRAEQYISFIADNEGVLYENIERAVNDEFNECCEMQQPAVFRIYDKENNPSQAGLDFEYRIFPLINDLCTLLNQIP